MRLLPQDYRYDVFLSWTGKDKQYKNNIKERLEQADLCYYDSDLDCNGQFRLNYMQALQSSKVYLLILTENLCNDPAATGDGTYTEVMNEINLAKDLEAHGDLNIIILNFSPFFCFKEVYRNANDRVGWFFYVNTRGYSRIDALDGLNEDVYSKLIKDVTELVDARNHGMPKLSQQPRLGVENMPIADCAYFGGREKELQTITESFRRGDRIVVLYGLGGIGKAGIAKRFALQCRQTNDYVCPQIVRIQTDDIRINTDIFGTVRSAVAYEESAVPMYATEAERRFSQEKVLSRLPEYAVLVIDNLLSVSAEELRLFSQKISCKMLITARCGLSREELNDCRAQGLAVEQIKIDSLTESVALRICSQIAAPQVIDPAEFSLFYSSVGGHTLTLCLAAKAMKVHKRCMRDLLEELNRTGVLDESVMYVDGADRIANIAISAHLDALFALDDFACEEKSRAILCNLSLMADGKMPIKWLCDRLQMDNRNVILRLHESGWLEWGDTGSVHGVVDADDVIYIHPLLSNLVNRRLHPTEQQASLAVHYLYDNSNNSIRLQYRDVCFVSDALYFAIFRLARLSGKLCHPLWERYETVSRLVSNMDAVQQECRCLLQVLTDTADHDRVQLYADMTLVERYPTRLDVLEPYLNTLESSARDYKFVLRSLSIVGQYIQPELNPQLIHILDKALQVAIDHDDRFAVMSLGGQCLMHRKQSGMYAMLKRYMSQRARAKDGSMQLLKLVDISIHLLYQPDSGIDFSLTTLRRHPLQIIKFYATQKRFQKVPTEDEMYAFVQAYSALVEHMVQNDAVSVPLVVNALRQLYLLQVKNNTTLQTFDYLVMNMAALIKKLPLTLQNELQSLVNVPRFNPARLTMAQLVDLRVAAQVHLWLNNPESIDMMQQWVKAESCLHAADHVDVVNARISLAGAYAVFPDKLLQALHEYIAIYHILTKKAQQSTKLCEVCNAILWIVSKLDDKQKSDNNQQRLQLGSGGFFYYLNQVLQTGLSCCVPYGTDALALQSNYIAALINFVPDLYPLSLAIQALKKSVQEATQYNGQLTSIYLQIADLMHDLCTRLANKKRFGDLPDLEDLWQQLLHSADGRDNAVIKVYYLFAKAYSLFHQWQIKQAAPSFDAMLAYAVKRHINRRNCTMYAFILWLNLCRYLLEDYSINGFARLYYNCHKPSAKRQGVIENVISCIDVQYDDSWIVKPKNNVADRIDILINHGENYCRRTIDERFGMTVAAWKRCRTIGAFKYRVMDALWGEFSDFARANQIWIAHYDKDTGKVTYSIPGTEYTYTVKRIIKIKSNPSADS